MASERQLAANLANSLRSTGPKSEAGKARSSRNARKHGLRSEREKVLRDASFAYENRLMKWSAIQNPENDIEEFLLNETVATSFEIERTRGAQIESARSLNENADEGLVETVEDLGDRLFYDPCGPTNLYGSRNDNWRKVRTSWTAKGVDPNPPLTLLRKLKSTATGCTWLLKQFTKLREHLERPRGFLAAGDVLRFIRLLGRQPTDAIDDHRVADIFAASYALDRTEEPFDGLQSDAISLEREEHVKKIRKRWPDLVGERERDKAKQILIDLIERNVARIRAKRAKHERNFQEQAERQVREHGFEKTRDGDLMRKHVLRSQGSLCRMFEVYRKFKKQDGGRRTEDGGPTTEDGGRRTEDGGRTAGEPRRRAERKIDLSWALDRGPTTEEAGIKAEDGGPTTEDGGRRTEDGGRTAGEPRRRAERKIDLSWALDRGPTTDDGGIRAQDGGPGAEPLGPCAGEIDVQDVPACQGLLPERCTDGLIEEEIGGSPGADAAGDCGDILPATTDSGDARDVTDEANFVTNEANSDDDVRIAQTQEIVEVVADSGVGSGLDTVEIEANFVCDESDRTRRPSDAECVEKPAASGEVLAEASGVIKSPDLSRKAGGSKVRSSKGSRKAKRLEVKAPSAGGRGGRKGKHAKAVVAVPKNRRQVVEWVDREFEKMKESDPVLPASELIWRMLTGSSGARRPVKLCRPRPP